MSWEAFPLPIARPGQPHFVEVEYPADCAQTLGISIVEPNAAGHMTPIGLDTGIDVPDTAVSREPRLAKHRVAFWPRTKRRCCCSRISAMELGPPSAKCAF